MRFFCNFFYKNRINIQVTYAHTHQRGRQEQSIRKKRERVIYTCSCSASAGLGLGCWAATPLDHLSNVAFDIAHIRRKIKTLPGKLPDQFKWPFFMARTRCTRSLPSPTLPLSVCLSVCECMCRPFSNLNSFMFYVHEVRSLLRVSSWTEK